MKEHKLFLLTAFIGSLLLSNLPDWTPGQAGLYAQETHLKFSQKTIEIKGTVNDVILNDINNDGVQEILFQQGRNLIIYTLQSTPTEANFIQKSIYRLPDDVCIFDIAKIDPSAFGETSPSGGQKQSLIYYISSKGISSLPIGLEIPGDKHQPVTSTLLFPTSTIFRDEVFDVPLHKNFLFNLDKEPSDGRAGPPDRMTSRAGRRVMVMPDINKFRFVYIPMNPLPIGEEVRSEKIRLPMTSNIYWDNSSIFEPLITEASLPSFVFADLNNDKRNDFIVREQNKIYGYSLRESDGGKPDYKNNGCLLETPDCNSLLVKDINDDGCADVVCADNKEGIIYVYLNKYGVLPQTSTSASGETSPSGVGQSNQSRYLSGFSDTPAQIIRTDSWIVKSDLIDLNNDALEDLVLVQMNKLGIIGGLQAILAQTLEWEIAVYVARPPLGRDFASASPIKDASTLLYPKSPDYIRAIKLPFSLSYAGSLFVGKSSELKIQIPYLWNLEGDFNGDKIRDLLISGVKDENLEIYLGDKSQIFNRSLSASVNLLSTNKKFKLTGESYISDINNDGKSDIIIPCEQKNPDKSVLHSYEILLSH